MSYFFDFHRHQGKFFDDERAIISLFPDEKICEFRKGIFFSSGIHPRFIPKNKSDLDELFRKLRQNFENDKFIALGECGLDRLSKTALKTQIEIFEQQIQIACEFHKPLIIHCVKAHGELLAIKKNLGKDAPQFCIHGFRGSAKLAEQLLNAEMILSFGDSYFRSNGNKDAFLLASEKIFFLESDESKEGIKPVYQSASLLLDLELEYLKVKIANWTSFQI